MHEIMTPEQVAEYLQVNTDTVYRLIRSKQLAASRIGRDYHIPRDDVDAFLLARLSEIGERNAARYPQLASDDVLEELEAYDAARRQAQSHAG